MLRRLIGDRRRLLEKDHCRLALVIGSFMKLITVTPLVKQQAAPVEAAHNRALRVTVKERHTHPGHYSVYSARLGDRKRVVVNR